MRQRQTFARCALSAFGIWVRPSGTDRLVQRAGAPSFRSCAFLHFLKTVGRSGQIRLSLEWKCRANHVTCRNKS